MAAHHDYEEAHEGAASSIFPEGYHDGNTVSVSFDIRIRGINAPEHKTQS